MNIYLDIETCPTQDPATLEAIRASIRPPANYKKPETIEAWMEAEGEAAYQAAVDRTALDATLGQVIAVGFAADDDEGAQVMVRGHDQPEGEFLQLVFSAIEIRLQENAITDANGIPVWSAEPHFIAHNAAFDLGFLWRRCVILGIRPPFRLPNPNARVGKDYSCTMEAWAGYRQRISLQNLCKALALPDPKENGNGKQAWEWWLDNPDDERISDYCGGDVEAVRAIWERVSPMLHNMRDVA